MDYLALARADFEYQEGYRRSLFERLQFLVTATTLLIAGDVTLVSNTPRGVYWWFMAALAAGHGILVARLFYYVWRMYWGHDYKEPKTVKDYLDWRDNRIAQLREAGVADAETIAESEVRGFLVDDYAKAADANRDVNLLVQAHMTGASRTVLAMTLVLCVQAVAFVTLQVL